MAEDANSLALIKILQEDYGILVQHIKKLYGMCDLTFSINCDQWIAKICMSPLGDDKRYPNAESDMIMFLYNKGFPVGEIARTKCGKFYSELEMLDGNSGEVIKRPVRLQKFLKGNLWVDYPLTVEMCTKAGSFIGQLTNAFQGFENSYYIENANYQFAMVYSKAWDCRLLKELVKDDERKYRLCEQAIELFDNEVVPVIDKLPKAQVHADCHGRNLLVDDNCENFVGLIDFGDSRYSCRVNEIVLALTAITGKEPTGDYEFTRAMMKSYKDVVSLTDLEMGVILPSFCGRMILHILASLAFEKESPDYSFAYIETIIGTRPWNVLDDLLNRPDERQKFLDAIFS